MEKQKITVLELIRLLSGIITTKDATDRLAIINLLSRYKLGLARKTFVQKTVKEIGFDLED